MLSYFKTTFVREEKNKMRYCIRCIVLIFAFTELSAFENIHGSWHLLIADRKAEICRFVSASPQGQGRSPGQQGTLSCPLWHKKSSFKVFIFENSLFLLFSVLSLSNAVNWNLQCSAADICCVYAFATIIFVIRVSGEDMQKLSLCQALNDCHLCR